MLTTFSGRNPSQNEFELRSLISLFSDKKVRSYLEIGARHGDTFHEVMSALPAESRGLALDLPGGLWGSIKTADYLGSVVSDLRSKGYDAVRILGNSTDLNVIQEVSFYGPFDAILIDGDHTYDGVKRDFENYMHLSKIIAFHDIVGEGQFEKVYGNKVEVPIFWNELKQKYKNHVEFVDRKSKMGIGVLFL